MARKGGSRKRKSAGKGGKDAPKKRRGLRRKIGRAFKRALKPKIDIAVPEGWRMHHGGKRLSIDIKTKDFMEAVGIINKLAAVAEELQHHPDFHLEEWNNLRITTWSHDVGKLTDRDERLAARINEALAQGSG
jgi:4a-hydroxytetrahydrobiopterin dehydratase